MDKELLESNIRFSKLYSTLYSVPTKDLKYADLYKSDNFKKWLQKPEYWLYLWSNSPWSWKTTTAIKLAKHLMNKWYKVMAVSLIDYKDLFKKEFWSKTNVVKWFKDHVYRYDYILLDDISYSVSSEWMIEILKSLLDKAFNTKTPKLILTAQVDISNLHLPKALQSRIKWICHSVHFPEKDRRATISYDF